MRRAPCLRYLLKGLSQLLPPCALLRVVAVVVLHVVALLHGRGSHFIEHRAQDPYADPPNLIDSPLGRSLFRFPRPEYQNYTIGVRPQHRRISDGENRRAIENDVAVGRLELLEELPHLLRVQQFRGICWKGAARQ